MMRHKMYTYSQKKKQDRYGNHIETFFISAKGINNARLSPPCGQKYTLKNGSPPP